MRKIFKPVMDLFMTAVVQFFKFWRDAPWTTKLATSPLLVLCLLFFGLYTFLFGCPV